MSCVRNVASTSKGTGATGQHGRGRCSNLAANAEAAQIARERETSLLSFPAPGQSKHDKIEWIESHPLRVYRDQVARTHGGIGCIILASLQFWIGPRKKDGAPRCSPQRGSFLPTAWITSVPLICETLGLDSSRRADRERVMATLRRLQANERLTYEITEDPWLASIDTQTRPALVMAVMEANVRQRLVITPPDRPDLLPAKEEQEIDQQQVEQLLAQYQNEPACRHYSTIETGWLKSMSANAAIMLGTLTWLSKRQTKDGRRRKLRFDNRPGASFRAGQRALSDLSGLSPKQTRAALNELLKRHQDTVQRVSRGHRGRDSYYRLLPRQ